MHTGAVRGVRCPLLVGRAEEVGLLSELVTAATHGRGGLAFVLGEPGIGKSRLLAAIADIARSRANTGVSEYFDLAEVLVEAGDLRRAA